MWEGLCSVSLLFVFAKKKKNSRWKSLIRLEAETVLVTYAKSCSTCIPRKTSYQQMIISSLASPLGSDSMWLSCREHSVGATQQARRKPPKPLRRSLPTTEHWEIPLRCQHKSQGNGLDIPRDLRECESLIGLFSTFSISSFTTSLKNTNF